MFLTHIEFIEIDDGGKDKAEEEREEEEKIVDDDDDEMMTLMMEHAYRKIDCIDVTGTVWYTGGQEETVLVN